MIRPSYSHLGNVVARGELAVRINVNFERLESAQYQPDMLFENDAGPSGWDGDREGRTILALVLLEQATVRKARYLEPILDRLARELNERGYLGTVYPDGGVCEQQLSGHGWLLRALCERVEAAERSGRADSAARDILCRVVEGLIIPTTGFHREYPIAPESRNDSGRHAGSSVGQIGRWIVSSDVGCDFIFLDGVVHAYDVLRDIRLHAVIEEIISRFLEVDLEAIHAQTHAMLTGLRALIRWYELHPHRSELLMAVEKRFALYRSKAMTANYENYNWFGRPEWTEPCAVIDSFMVATSLWRHTGQAEYLELAHRVLLNGVFVEQRENGGFGCDSCVAAEESCDLSVSVDEAHWCCTMRGAEGLTHALRATVLESEDGIWIPFYHDVRFTTATSAPLEVEMETGYPTEGWVTLRIISAAPMAKQVDTVPFHLFIPRGSTDVKLRLNGVIQSETIDSGFVRIERAWRAGDLVELRFETQVAFVRPAYREPSDAATASGVTVEYGPLVLAAKNQAASGDRSRTDGSPADGFPADGWLGDSVAPRDIVRGEGNVWLAPSGLELTPLMHLLDPAVAKGRGFRRRVLFKAPAPR